MTLESKTSALLPYLVTVSDPYMSDGLLLLTLPSFGNGVIVCHKG